MPPETKPVPSRRRRLRLSLIGRIPTDQLLPGWRLSGGKRGCAELDDLYSSAQVRSDAASNKDSAI
jgi:hypothetical protein